MPDSATLNNTTLAPVRAVQAALAHRPGVIGVTGTGAIEQDYSHAVFGNFPLMFAIIAIVTFLLLARAFRSLLLAGKAVVLNVLSLAATFGLMNMVLARRPWLAGHLWHPGHRCDHVLDPAYDLRVSVWAVDGLRGLHPHPRYARNTTAPATRIPQ